MLFDIDTAWVFSKIISIPDKKYFSEKAIGYTAIYSINFFRMFPLVLYPPPSFDLVMFYLLCRNADDARYRMICLKVESS